MQWLYEWFKCHLICIGVEHDNKQLEQWCYNSEMSTIVIIQQLRYKINWDVWFGGVLMNSKYEFIWQTDILFELFFYFLLGIELIGMVK